MSDISRISVKGQVTIPSEIRKRLKLKNGDKVAFLEKSGEIILMNSNRLAFEEFQRAMAGEAEKAGLNSDQDVVDFIKEIRANTQENRH